MFVACGELVVSHHKMMIGVESDEGNQRKQESKNDTNQREEAKRIDHYYVVVRNGNNTS